MVPDLVPSSVPNLVPIPGHGVEPKPSPGGDDDSGGGYLSTSGPIPGPRPGPRSVTLPPSGRARRGGRAAMAWMRMMGVDSVAYHRATVMDRADDHPGAALGRLVQLAR